MKIKIVSLMVAMLLLLAPLAAQAQQTTIYPPQVPQTPVKGLTFIKYEEAVKQATEENKLLMLFFWADWCGYCTKIRKDVFENDKVREPFEKTFVAVSVDLGNDPEKLAMEFKPKALPTMAFLRPDGEVLGLLPGYIDLKTFIEVVDLISTEAFKNIDKSAAPEKK